eukprot:CAMPEP_0196720650 /NCGR_PEP_ID=MMETSP1091-20130531/3401_1 /TAXON_ID=302021 /ORGANISM="Rhodomonas sp., Strain CCMP768" /LENGTH=147 /DNA_ID=CAMNT_0042061949 /DNA_START=28 /DNA_END=471 /DNA_ORIENTATION=-
MQVCDRCAIPIVAGSRDVKMCAGSIGPGQMGTGIDVRVPGMPKPQAKNWCCNCAYTSQMTYANTDFHNSYKRYGCDSCHQSLYTPKGVFSSKCKWCDQGKDAHILVTSSKSGSYGGWLRCDPTFPKNMDAIGGVDVPMANFSMGAAY